MDNPWKGQEIAVFDVPATDALNPAATTLTQPVPAVEGLTGKHAVYLIAEGADIQPKRDDRPQWGRRPQQPQRPDGLFDLHGIGFSKGSAIQVPAVPQITIKVNGKQLLVPTTPIRTTNQNGYTDLTHYQVYAPLNGNNVIEAYSSVPGVETTFSPVTDGRATVRCKWQGKEKIYLIN